MKSRGKQIREVSTCKVFETKIADKRYLNINSLEYSEVFYIWKIEQKIADSIHIRYLSDSLKTSFESSENLYAFLENEEKSASFFSEKFTLYKYGTLNWDQINLKQQTSTFKAYYAFGKMNEENFVALSSEEITQELASKKRTSAEILIPYFEGIKLVRYEGGFWKASQYGIIELNSGDYLKIKYDLHGNGVYDMTNDIYYSNRNEEKWFFD